MSTAAGQGLSRRRLDPRMTGAARRQGVERLPQRGGLVRDLVGRLVDGKGGTP